MAITSYIPWGQKRPFQVVSPESAIGGSLPVVREELDIGMGKLSTQVHTVFTNSHEEGSAPEQTQTLGERIYGDLTNGE